MLGDLQLDAALPLARLGAFFGSGADQRRRRMLLFEVFPNRDGLADALAVVELERGQLSAGIAIGVRRLAIFGLQQIDVFVLGIVIPFSARNIRIARGLGPNES